MPGTAGPEYKTRRAKIHLEALQQAIDAFIQSHPYRLFDRDDTETGEYVVKLVSLMPEIWPIGPILGDFVNCLRSALDHLVYGLVILHGSKPSFANCFPIYAAFGSDTLAKIRAATNGIPSDAVAIIESLQPYNAGSAAKISHLYRLNALWNVDKHRHIPLHSMGSDFLFPKCIPATSIALVDDAAEMRFPLVRKPDVKLDPGTYRPFIQFGNDDVGVVVKFADLVEMYEFVCEKVIPRFDRFYEKAKVAGQ